MSEIGFLAHHPWRKAISSGDDSIRTNGGTQIWLGTTLDQVTTTGADTVIGGTGSATVSATAGNAFVFEGAGPLQFLGGAGTSTILGLAGGSATLFGGSGSIIDVSYGDLVYVGGDGADTLGGFGGSMTVHGGTGRSGGPPGLYVGGPAGHNVITAGIGQAIIIGGGDGDVLTASGIVGDAIEAGVGAETISGLGSSGANNFYAGSGNDLILAGSGTTQIQAGTGAVTMVAGTGTDVFAAYGGWHAAISVVGFDPSRDFVALQNYGTGEAASVLANAVTSSGPKCSIPRTAPRSHWSASAASFGQVSHQLSE